MSCIDPRVRHAPWPLLALLVMATDLPAAESAGNRPYFSAPQVTAQAVEAATQASIISSPAMPASQDRPAARPDGFSQESIDAARKAAAHKSTEELRNSLSVKRGSDGDTAVMPGEVMFDSASDRLRPEAVTILAETAEMIRREGSKSLRVVGHTDSLGSLTYNFELSKRRARAVGDWLVREGGLPKQDVISLGLGPDRPKASNDTPSGRMQNRRVEVLMPPADPVHQPVAEKK